MRADIGIVLVDAIGFFAENIDIISRGTQNVQSRWKEVAGSKLERDIGVGKTDHRL